MIADIILRCVGADLHDQVFAVYRWGCRSIQPSSTVKVSLKPVMIHAYRQGHMVYHTDHPVFTDRFESPASISFVFVPRSEYHLPHIVGHFA